MTRRRAGEVEATGARARMPLTDFELRFYTPVSRAMVRAHQTLPEPHPCYVRPRRHSLRSPPMKTERRHELQKNELADWLGHSYHTAKPFSKTVLAVIVAVVVVAGTAWFLMNRAASKRSAAWDRYFVAAQSGQPDEGLRSVIEEHPNTPAAQWAKIHFADTSLQQGIDSLFTDRTQAKEKLEEALANYTEVADDSSDAALNQRSLYGVAVTNEALGNFDEARSGYETVIEKHPNGLYAVRSKERLDDLNQSSTKEFNEWFASFEPPKPAKGPGRPGEKPDFDFLPEAPTNPKGTSVLDGLPTSGADKLPSAADKLPEGESATGAEKAGEGEQPAETPPPAAPEPPAAPDAPEKSDSQDAAPVDGDSSKSGE